MSRFSKLRRRRLGGLQTKDNVHLPHACTSYHIGINEGPGMASDPHANLIDLKFSEPVVMRK